MIENKTCFKQVSRLGEKTVPLKANLNEIKTLFPFRTFSKNLKQSKKYEFLCEIGKTVPIFNANCQGKTIYSKFCDL